MKGYILNSISSDHHIDQLSLSHKETAYLLFSDVGGINQVTGSFLVATK
jgi:hypothetical protein